MTAYLNECQVCCKQHTVSTKTKFQSRANNYRIRHPPEFYEQNIYTGETPKTKTHSLALLCRSP